VSRLSNVRAWTEQTDRHTTDRHDLTHYQATFAGTNKYTVQYRQLCIAVFTSKRVLMTVNGNVVISATPRAQAPIISDSCARGGVSVLYTNKHHHYHHLIVFIIVATLT